MLHGLANGWSDGYILYQRVLLPGESSSCQVDKKHCQRNTEMILAFGLCHSGVLANSVSNFLHFY